jgi:hypothetical protein
MPVPDPCSGRRKGRGAHDPADARRGAPDGASTSTKRSARLSLAPGPGARAYGAPPVLARYRVSKSRRSPPGDAQVLCPAPPLPCAVPSPHRPRRQRCVLCCAEPLLASLRPRQPPEPLEPSTHATQATARGTSLLPVRPQCALSARIRLVGRGRRRVSVVRCPSAPRLRSSPWRLMPRPFDHPSPRPVVPGCL